ncbi:hypothetical protein FOA43_002159 [Brettanomyces nanus]|uniref:Ubiquitin carboxyl-terminal hydrolase n=1 Tax=Eeniella nana TaxID=13502 RepID=A0A875S1M4_EENNA|nr:uncharacterized protein FOA43_002159 [Brettanomyces nanus]QPG74823.1 hypothetical protein FOA43_002159 [Brettanomyces nanus]
MSFQDFGSVVPLESNPEIFTEFGRKLGLSPLLNFFDIYSITDPDLLAFIPRPLNSIILLFPITEQYEKFKKEEEEEEEKAAQPHQDNFESVIWFKQLLKNACGLYGLLHAICNLPTGLIVDQSQMCKFVENIKALPEVSNSNHFYEKTKLISDLFLSTYNDFSQQGQTEAPSAEDDVDLHFICFAKGKNGHFFELDGRRDGPLDLGEPIDSHQDVLASQAILSRIKKYMSLADDKNGMNFAMMGLGPVME